VAVEVDDIAEQRVLPAELQVEHVAVSKELPGGMLRPCCVFAQLTRSSRTQGHVSWFLHR
jgi:hypothetical protein